MDDNASDMGNESHGMSSVYDEDDTKRRSEKSKEVERRRKLYGLSRGKKNTENGMTGSMSSFEIRKAASMSDIQGKNSMSMRSRSNGFFTNDLHGRTAHGHNVLKGRLSKTSDGLITGGSEAALTDDKGKALYGTPGPGSYQSTSSFGPSQVYSSASRYSFGVKGMRYPFISKEHAQNERGTQSPGPVYAARSPDMIRSVSFGVAGRNSGSVQFISHYHCRENRGRSTPGPGTYHVMQDQSLPLDSQDMPGFTFCSSAQRMQLTQRAETPSPSHYQCKSSLGSSPSYSFAPGGELERGKACDKNKASAIFISEEHARASSPRATTPGPGTYTWSSTIEVSHARPHFVDTASSARMKRASAYSFGKSKKFTEATMQPFVSRQHMSADPASPGPVYNFNNKESSRNSDMPTTKFGTSKRFFDPGTADAGPLLSKAHSKSSLLGVHSPGPAYKLSEGKGVAGTLGDAPTWKFPTSERDLGTNMSGDSYHEIPGPGAYMPRNAAECSGSNGMFRSSPQHSLAGKHSSIWNVNKNVSSLPGPGTYRTKAVSNDVSKPKSPCWHFGVCKDRSSFVQTNPVPGPGAYIDKEHCHRKVEKSAPAYTFGTDNDRARRKQGKVIRAVYISKLHNEEKLGASSPGPGAYKSYAGNDMSNRQHSFNVRNLQFGTSNRDSFYKQYCGSEYAQGGESPGPGTYAEKMEVRKDGNQKKIGFSFGTSKRPPINITSLRC